MADLAKRVVRTLPWILILLFVGFFTFLQMTIMSGAVSDGWQSKDLSHLVPLLLFGGLIIFSVRRIQRAWYATDALDSESHMAIDSAAQITTRRWRIGTSVAGVIVMGALIYLGIRQAPPTASYVVPADQASIPRIMTRIARSPCDGCTNESFDAKVANEVREELAADFLARMKNAARESGQDSESLNVQSDLELNEFNGRQLIIIHLAIPGVSRAVVAMGLVGEETVEVRCVTETEAAISLASGACLEGLQAAFPARD